MVRVGLGLGRLRCHFIIDSRFPVHDPWDRGPVAGARYRPIKKLPDIQPQ